MAEPVIISYARGLLREFPGVPEGTVDVIPVDLVVAAIIAVAALGPDRRTADLPGRIGRGQPVQVPRARRQRERLVPRAPAVRRRGPADRRARVGLPGRGRVQAQLTRAKKVITTGEKLLQSLPLRGKQAELSARLETKRAEVERALEYVELYGLYTECEAIYQIDHLLKMWDGLDATDQPAFAFDPRVIDWPTYIREVHLPSIVQHARVKTHPGKTRTTARHGCAGRSCPPSATSPPSTSRTRSSRATSSRATRGWRPAASTGRAAALRAAHAHRGAGPAALDRRDRATSCATSTGATRTPRSTRSRRRQRAPDRSLILDQELPRRAASGARASRPRPSHAS